jgi:hypothetical protein
MEYHMHGCKTTVNHNAGENPQARKNVSIVTANIKQNSRNELARGYHIRKQQARALRVIDSICSCPA